MEESVVTEKSLLEYVRKSTPPPFLMKTYVLVDDPFTNDVVSWNSDGSAFVVWKPAEFSRDLLPTLFKHNNFSSFVRQLNTYGFRKVATTRWEFSNDMFRQGKRELLCQIRRRKASTKNPQPRHHHQNESHNQNATNHDQRLPEEDEQRSSSTSWSSGRFGSLVDENKRLKEENVVLSSEIVSMKRKCKELVDLVHDKYNNGSEEKENGNGDDERPKLFGVRLELVQGEMERKRKLLCQSCN